MMAGNVTGEELFARDEVECVVKVGEVQVDEFSNQILSKKKLNYLFSPEKLQKNQMVSS